MLNKLKQLFKDSFLYGIGNLITKASGLILLPLYAFYTSKAEIGLLTFYETAFTFLLVIGGWGAKGGFSRWYNEMKNEQERKSLFFTTYTFNVFTSFLGVVVIALLLLHLNVFESANRNEIVLWFSISSLSKLLFDVPFILLKLQQKAFKQIIYQSGNVGLTIVFTMYFLEYREMGFEGIFFAQMFANSITLLIVLPLIIKSCYVKFQIKVLGEMLNYGYPIAISNILTTVLVISDRYILEAYSSMETVGSFGVAFKVANLLQFLVLSSFITSYTYEYYRSMNQKDGSRFHLKTFTYFIFLMVLAGLGIVFFGKQIIYIIMAGKTEYYDALPVIPFFIIGLIFSGMRQVFALPLTKAKKTKWISIVMILSGVLNVGLNFLVIPSYGKEGAAVSTALTQLLAAICFLMLVNKVEKIIYEWKKISLVLVVGAVYCLVHFIIPSFNFVVDVFIRIILIITFLIVLYVLGFFEQVEKERIKQFWHKWKNLSQLKSNISQLKK